MKSFLFVVFYSCFALTDLAWGQAAPSAQDRLYSLFSNYNQRYATGSYVANPTLAENFILAQTQTVQNFLASGHLKKILTVENDFDASLVIELFVLTDDSQNLLGFYYSKTKYFDREEESYLRFKILDEVAKGIGFVPIGGQHAVTIKGFHLKPSESATLQFTYLKDLRKNLSGVLNLFILKKNGSWALYSETYLGVSELYIKSWKKIFPPNGGVSELVLR